MCMQINRTLLGAECHNIYKTSWQWRADLFREVIVPSASAHRHSWTITSEQETGQRSTNKPEKTTKPQQFLSLDASLSRWAELLPFLFKVFLTGFEEWRAAPQGDKHKNQKEKEKKRKERQIAHICFLGLCISCIIQLFCEYFANLER